MIHNTIVAVLLIPGVLADPATMAASNETNSFKDFREKYDPSTVWEQIDKQKVLKGANYTKKEEFDMFLKGIDPTDEILSLPVVNGDARIMLEKSGRRWRPPGKLVDNSYDPWSVGRRLLELMKQAIYQARNKMIIMQELRAAKRKNALYKMGFLFAKTDLMAKTFASVATKSFRACSMKQQRNYGSAYHKYYFIEIVYSHERLMQLWFDIDLMIDIIESNDNIALEILKKYSGVERLKVFDESFND